MCVFPSKIPFNMEVSASTAAEDKEGSNSHPAPGSQEKQPPEIIQDKENSPPRSKSDGKHQCETCGKVFHVESRLKRHVATHTGADKVQCEICSRILGARDQYVVHMKRLHGLDVTKTGQPGAGATSRKKSFSCDVCSKIFVNGYKLRRHMNVHTGEEKSQCTVCFKWVASKQALINHMARHEGDISSQQPAENPSIICKICDTKFQCVEQLLVHLEVHDDSCNFICSLCNQTSNNKKDFMVHLMTTHPIIQSDKPGKTKKINECYICNKSFPGHSALLRHINYHTKENIISCKLCNKSIANKDHLPLHMERYHPELYEKIRQLLPKKSSGFTCEFCGEKFPGRHKLDTHRRVHEMFQCPLCPTRLQNVDTLQRHMSLHVDNGYTGDITSILPEKKTLVPKFEPAQKEKISKGDFILTLMENDFKEVFVQESSNEVVLNEKTGETESLKSDPDNANNSQKEIDPGDYLKEYINKEEHNVKHKTKSRKPPYICNECNKVFTSYSRLQRHINSHTGQERVKCRLCKKSICSKDRLDRHIQKKHPQLYQKLDKYYFKKEAGFLCKICLKKFPSRSKLERHRKVYDKAFQCPACPLMFHSTVCLRRHMALHQEYNLHDVESILNTSQIQIKEDDQENIVRNKGDWIMELMKNKFRDLPASDDESNADNNESVETFHDEEPYFDDYDAKYDESPSKQINSASDLDDKTENEVSNECQQNIDEASKLETDTKITGDAFACNFCSREFILHQDLKCHVLSHISVKIFECDTCNETFTTRKWIQIHGLQCSGSNRRSTHSDITCQDCDIYFLNHLDQTNHHKLFHEDEIKQEIQEMDSIMTEPVTQVHILCHDSDNQGGVSTSGRRKDRLAETSNDAIFVPKEENKFCDEDISENNSDLNNTRINSREM